MWTPLHAGLHITLRQRHLLKKNDRLLVAVSGGQDSLCLLKLLVDLQPKWGWELAVAHCDHRWTWEGGMAACVRKIAADWNLPYYQKTAENLKQTEAAAREWRYQSLTAIAQERNFSIVVTGHTQSDRAETLLYNLIRGAGGSGLSALTWKRPLTTEIELIRPLLAVSRQETLEFCQQLQLPVWPDPSNENLNYARNRLRREVIPYLQTHFNPQVEAALAQTAELLRADRDYLERAARELLQRAMAPDGRAVNRQPLQEAPLSLQRRAIGQFLEQSLATRPNFQQVEGLVSLISAANRTRTSSLPGGAIAEVRGDWIAIETGTDSGPLLNRERSPDRGGLENQES